MTDTTEGRTWQQERFEQSYPNASPDEPGEETPPAEAPPPAEPPEGPSEG